MPAFPLTIRQQGAPIVEFLPHRRMPSFRQTRIFGVPMDLLLRIRKFENLHIVFWLLKDSCWMMEFKAAGTAMIVPTFLLAVYILAKTLGHREGFINASILCWIIANSYWMIVEFFFDDRHRNLSAIPFVAGFIFVVVYYLKRPEGNGADTGGIPGGL